MLDFWVTDLGMQFVTGVRSGGVSWFIVRDLVDIGSVMVPSTNVDEVERAIVIAFAADDRHSKHHPMDEAIFSRFGIHWDARSSGGTPSDPNSPEAGNLCIDQIVCFYASEETLKDAANHCAKTLSRCGSLFLSPLPAGDVDSHIAELNEKLARQVRDAEQRKRQLDELVEAQDQELTVCWEQVTNQTNLLAELNHSLVELKKQCSEMRMERRSS